MRGFHVVLSSRIDVARTRAEIAAGLRPRHFMLHVAELLGARVHEPETDARPKRFAVVDRILNATAQTAALAEAVAEAAGDDDVAFCNSESASLPLADRLIAAGKRTKLVALVHNLIRPRILLLMAATGVVRRHAALYPVSPLLAEGLKRRLARPPPEVTLLAEQIDDEFFTPGLAGPKSRPLIASVGLERRDYRTLADATRELSVDVRVAAFSRDAKASSRMFPVDMPGNMERRFYDWPELRQLYRDADLVVAPLRENRYAAGLTSLLEGMAAARPVIAAATAGLAGVFADEAAIRWVPPGEAGTLRRAIESLLGDGGARDALAARGARLLKERHTENKKAQEMAARLQAL